MIEYLRKVAGALSVDDKVFAEAWNDIERLGRQINKYTAQILHKPDFVIEKGKEQFKNDQTGNLLFAVNELKKVFEELNAKLNK